MKKKGLKVRSQDKIITVFWQKGSYMSIWDMN